MRGAPAVKRVLIKNLKDASKEKPEGYIEDVMSYVVEKTDTHIVLENDDYHMLRKKYSGDADESLRGPGTELHKLLSKFGIRMKKGCSCRGRVVQMNMWGCDACEENIDVISGWLKEESEKRGLPYVECIAKLIVRTAIKKARKQCHTQEIKKG